MKIQYRKIVSDLTIIFPIYFLLFVALLEMFFPGYKTPTEYISVLGAASSPVKILMNIFGFLFFGITLLVFASDLQQKLKNIRPARTGLWLIRASALLIILLGIFPADRLNTLPTSAGFAHKIISLSLFFLLPIGIALCAQAFKDDGDWGKFWTWLSWIAAGASVFATALLILNNNSDTVGLIERLGVGVVLLWLFLVSFNIFLLRKTKEWLGR